MKRKRKGREQKKRKEKKQQQELDWVAIDIICVMNAIEIL